MHRFVIVISLGLLLTLAQCGLERPLLAWSVPLYYETAGTTLKFRSRADYIDDSSREFLGYVVYYKIGLDASEFVSDINLQDENELTAHGFKLLRSSADRWDPLAIQSPLIITNNPDGGTDYIITLDFNDVSLPTASSSIPNFSPYELRRIVQDATPAPDYGYFKRFSEFYNGDSDINQSVFAGLVLPDNRGHPIRIFMAVYVYAYGKSLNSQTLWRDIKSPLLYLNYIETDVYYDDGNP